MSPETRVLPNEVDCRNWPATPLKAAVPMNENASSAPPVMASSAERSTTSSPCTKSVIWSRVGLVLPLSVSAAYTNWSWPAPPVSRSPSPPPVITSSPSRPKSVLPPLLPVSVLLSPLPVPVTDDVPVRISFSMNWPSALSSENVTLD